MAVRGGKKLAQFLREAKRAKNVRGVEAGFYSSAKYPDGTPVTNVAAWNEFGSRSVTKPIITGPGKAVFVRRDTPKNIPERPFFRQAIKRMPEPLLETLKENVDPKKMVVDRHVAGLLGKVMRREIQDSIRRLRKPANAQEQRSCSNRVATP